MDNHRSAALDEQVQNLLVVGGSVSVLEVQRENHRYHSNINIVLYCLQGGKAYRLLL